MSSFNFSLPVAIGCDHAGFEYKNELILHLEKKGLKIKDFGSFSNESVDYPDYVHPTAQSVAKGEASFGILLCGSANGVCITANKHKEIRAALCWMNDIARLVRQHNNANIICLPARFVSIHLCKDMVDIFIETAFEGGRHALRINKISCI
jgi:ribose 5-phosphate isomerase B